MSRSRRHTPAFGYCADSDKYGKMLMHRKWRVDLRLALAVGDYERAEYDDYSASHCNVWSWAKDGKGYWPAEPDNPDWQKMMRK
jgi:hypothetical protein